MAQAELYNRLNALQDSIKQTSQLIVKLARSQPSNGNGLELTATGNTESSDTQTSLSTDIQEALKQSEEDLELLQQDIEDLGPLSQQNSSFRKVERPNVRVSEKERQYAQYSATCSRISEELKLAHARFRKAQMQAKRNADRVTEKEQVAYVEELRANAESYHAKSQESQTHDQVQTQVELRNSLFGSRKYGGKTNANGTKDDMLLSASSDLTSSLRQTHDLLSSELSRSRFAHETLASSNSALEELNKRYGTLDDLLSKSRGLLGSLLRSQKSDTWYLETAMYILFGTIAWLLFRRILYGPTWWLVWQPIRLAWKAFSAVVGVLFGLAPSKRTGSSRSTSLIIQPSATEGLPSFARGSAPSVQVGGGGRGGPVGNAPPGMDNDAARTPYSDRVEAIVQATRNPSAATETTLPPESTGEGDRSDSKPDAEDESSKDSKDDNSRRDREEAVRRGDGEELKKRDPNADPPNPKKRMWEGHPPKEPKSKDEL